MRFFATLVAILLLPTLAFAQASLPTDMTDAEALDALLKGLSGAKGAGALGIAILATQATMFALQRTPLGNLLGKWTLLLVTGVSVISTVLAGKSMGMTWMAALLSGPVVAAAQVFVHQLFVQFSPAKVAADKGQAS